jgi:hypothetical protein
VDVVVVRGLEQGEIRNDQLAVGRVDVESLDLTHQMGTLHHEVVLAVAKYPRPSVGVLYLCLHLHGCTFDPVDVSDEVVVEDQLRRVAVVLVLVLWDDTPLLVDLDVLPVDVEGGETPLVTLLLLAVVLRPYNPSQLVLEAFVEGHLHSAEGVLVLVVKNAASKRVSLDLLLAVGLPAH